MPRTQVCAPGLEDAVGGRVQMLALYAAAGAASALSCVLSQLVLGRRTQPRSAVSGAMLGLLLLRAATWPNAPFEVGGLLILKPLRAILLHVILDSASNALPAPPPPRGVEKMLALLGAAVFVAALQPGLRSNLHGALDWQRLLEYAREAL